MTTNTQHIFILSIIAIAGSVFLAYMLISLYRSKSHASSVSEALTDAQLLNLDLQSKISRLDREQQNTHNSVAGLRSTVSGLLEQLNLKTLELSEVKEQAHLLHDILGSSRESFYSMSLPMSDDNSTLGVLIKTKNEAFTVEDERDHLNTRLTHLLEENKRLSVENLSYMRKVSRVWQRLDSKEQPAVGDYINLLSGNLDGTYAVHTSIFVGWGDKIMDTSHVYRWSKVYPVPTRLLAADVAAAIEASNTLE